MRGPNGETVLSDPYAAIVPDIPTCGCVVVPMPYGRRIDRVCTRHQREVATYCNAYNAAVLRGDWHPLLALGYVWRAEE